MAGRNPYWQKRKNRLVKLVCQAVFDNSYVALDELEREDRIHAEEGLAGATVFVEGYAIDEWLFFVPNPANFWSDNQIWIEAIVQTNCLVVNICVADAVSFSRDVEPL